MVEVFRTNIKSRAEESRMLNILRKEFPHCRINFDLEDCDHILRLETLTNQVVSKVDVMMLVKRQGFEIGVLPDVVELQGSKIPVTLTNP